MKHLLTILIIAFTATAASGQLIKNEIDEFTGERVIQYSHETIEHEGFNGRVTVSAFYTSPTYYFVLTVRSEDSWQILGANGADFVIDGQRKRHTLIRVDTDISSGSTTELYGIVLTAREFQDMGRAETVRFRINGNIYQLTPEAIQGFAAVHNEVNNN